MSRIEGSSSAPQRPARPVPPPATPAPEPRPRWRDLLTLSPTRVAAASVAAAPVVAVLTAEEQQLRAAGLLPASYAELKAVLEAEGREAAREHARKGVQGPFSPGWGDPVVMLQGARRIQSHPELLRMFQDLKQGDLLIESWNSKNLISDLTEGPFIHTAICTADGPPPEFIEAMGITGSSSDEGASVVRRTSLYEHSYDALTVRVLRPTEGMEPAARDEAIERATAYAARQLGKPYDYSFTDVNEGTGLTNAFYCSELTYLAYASPEGAHLNVPLSKSPERDELLVALGSMIDALEPRDRPELMDRAMKLVNRNPRPEAPELVGFVVDEVLAKCRTTEQLASTPKGRKQLKQAINLILEGKAFPRLEAATRAYREAEEAGDFKTPWLGGLKRQAARTALWAGGVRDAASLVGISGLDVWAAIRTTQQLVGAVLPHAETFTSYLWGPKSAPTQAAGQVLDAMTYLHDHAPNLPLLGDLGLGSLPRRAKPTIKTDFVSPSDLGWAPIWHRDYNVKADHPIEAPAR